MNQGLIIAAPGSGNGKTTLTLGVLRALARKGVAVRAAKSGPDYIDTRFHAAACGTECLNLDAWAMSKERLLHLAQGDGTLIIEGAMGLFDGAPPTGKGATADLARRFNLPVVLVVDASHMAQSVAPLVLGFARHDPAVNIVGVILNKVGSPRHETMLRRALDDSGITILGAIHRQAGLAHPSRHLGLVPATERPDLEPYLEKVADVVEAAIDLDRLVQAAASLPVAGASPRRIAPFAQRIAIASDAAFQFAYPHILEDWRAAGAELSQFSPLNNESPAGGAYVFLPGGYPELHAGRLSGAETFFAGLRKAAATGVYGECGGYMVLGETLTDADGNTHRMAGLLGVSTSFEKRKLHLGYRQLAPLGGPFERPVSGHEFHYTSIQSERGEPLFSAKDAEGTALPDMGLRNGGVCGSFAHVID